MVVLVVLVVSISMVVALVVLVLVALRHFKFCHPTSRIHFRLKVLIHRWNLALLPILPVARLANTITVVVVLHLRLTRITLMQHTSNNKEKKGRVPKISAPSVQAQEMVCQREEVEAVIRHQHGHRPINIPIPIIMKGIP